MQNLILSSAPGNNWLPFLFILIGLAVLAKGGQLAFHFLKAKWKNRIHHTHE